jgi:hypothetical protein
MTKPKILWRGWLLGSTDRSLIPRLRKIEGDSHFHPYDDGKREGGYQYSPSRRTGFKKVWAVIYDKPPVEKP